VIVAEGKLDDPVPGKVELLAVVRIPSVLDEDLLGFREGRRDAPVLEAPVSQLCEYHPPPAASSGQLGSIGGPPDLHDAADLGSLPPVRPSSFIAKPDYVVATDRKRRAIGPPGDAGDDVLVGVGGVNGKPEAAMGGEEELKLATGGAMTTMPLALRPLHSLRPPAVRTNRAPPYLSKIL
jgi:hypothetical protein